MYSRRDDLHGAHGSLGSSRLLPEGAHSKTEFMAFLQRLREGSFLMERNKSHNITRFPAALNAADTIRGPSL